MCRFIAGLSLLAALIVPMPTLAQSIWMDMGPRGNATAQFLKPNFSGASNLTFFNYGLFITSRIPISEAVGAFVVELPVTHSSLENPGPFSDGETSQTMLGNTYLGFDVGPRESAFRAEFGLRLPTAPDDKFEALVIGTFADIERLGHTVPEGWVINAMVNAIPKLGELAHLRFRFGPSLIKPKDDDVEILLLYGAIVGVENPFLIIKGGISALTFLTAEASPFSSEGSSYIFGLSGGPKFGSFYLGIDLRAPIAGDLHGSLDSVIGVSVSAFFSTSD